MGRTLRLEPQDFDCRRSGSPAARFRAATVRHALPSAPHWRAPHRPQSRTAHVRCGTAPRPPPPARLRETVASARCRPPAHAPPPLSGPRSYLLLRSRPAASAPPPRPRSPASAAWRRRAGRLVRRRAAGWGCMRREGLPRRTRQGWMKPPARAGAPISKWLRSRLAPELLAARRGSAAIGCVGTSITGPRDRCSTGRSHPRALRRRSAVAPTSTPVTGRCPTHLMQRTNRDAENQSKLPPWN